jgi:hypothetical protein
VISAQQFRFTYWFSFLILLQVQTCHEKNCSPQAFHWDPFLCWISPKVFPKGLLILKGWRKVIIQHFLMKYWCQPTWHWRCNPNPISWTSSTNLVLFIEKFHELDSLKKWKLLIVPNRILQPRNIHYPLRSSNLDLL